MKKIIAVILTLLALLSCMTMGIAAEETTTAEVPAEEETTYLCTCPNCVTEEEAAEEETTSMEIKFGFKPETLKETLPIMGMGMLGIFLVTSVIILAVVLLSKIGSKKEE